MRGGQTRKGERALMMNKTNNLPVLYSFRRCPYAMRARLALASSGQGVVLREVILRDKPEEMLLASPKATVPVLILEDGNVLEESIDIMHWAMRQSDREGLRDFPAPVLEEMDALIGHSDGSFKQALDRYKYPNRYIGVERDEQREAGAQFIRQLDGQLAGRSYLFGECLSFADLAILPFVRQFAHVDRDWFWQQPWPNVIKWLEAFIDSERFAAIMTKYPQWKSGEDGVIFGW